jgi:hypothetical protein
MERLREVRVLFRHFLAQHYVDSHPIGPDVEGWLMRWGGWFPDPQYHYDGFPPRDGGVDAFCPDLRAALEEADVLLMLNGATA